MKLLVTYDITDDHRRDHTARTLLDYGQRVQGSVFFLDAEEDLIDRMRQRIGAIIDHELDSVWFVFLCEACVRRLETLGITKAPQVPEVYIV